MIYTCYAILAMFMRIYVNVTIFFKPEILWTFVGRGSKNNTLQMFKFKTYVD